jgi:hypothetical protein
MKRGLFALVACCVVACSQSRQREGEPPDGTPPPPPASPPAGRCIALWERCEMGGDPCCEGFCGVTGYGLEECVPLAERGEFCVTDSECGSGICGEGACAEPRNVVACVALGGSCADDPSSCCPGSRCAPYSYTIESQTCVVQALIGEECFADGDCESGHCIAGVCQGECLDTPSTCWESAECCTGFCTYSNDSYGPGFCSRPLPAGEACRYNGWCASRVCTDGTCQ